MSEQNDQKKERVLVMAKNWREADMEKIGARGTQRAEECNSRLVVATRHLREAIDTLVKAEP